MAEIRLGMAILAAGSSQRFGGTDKLTAPLRRTMLGEHVAWTVGGKGFKRACVITSRKGHPCEPGWIEAGFEPVLNERAQEGMGTSVALAAQLAMEAKVDKLLIALADMPFVPRSHYSRLILAVDGPDAIQTSARGDTRMPPAVFGRDHFAALAQCEGNTGARDLLRQAEIVPCPPEWLIDIDTAQALREHGHKGPLNSKPAPKGDES